MKILNPQQIKQCDDLAISELPITSIDLMEMAATACVNFITEKIQVPDKTLIFCGKGNNGGDGLAIARLLKEKNYEVEVFIVEYSKSASPDFDKNFKRFKGDVKLLHSINDLEISSSKNTLIIDAIFGIGLSRALDGLIRDVVEKLNAIEGFRLSIDIPTGLYADLTTRKDQSVFKAQRTLTFQSPKLNFMMKENYSFVGEFEVLNIGWPEEADKEMEADHYYTTPKEIRTIYKKRERFVSKHNFGHALIIAGSYGKIGAAALAAKACLRSGAGLTTVYSPACGYAILQSQAPEAMCISDSNNDHITSIPDLEKYSSVAVGSGIGLNEETKKMVAHLISECKVPLVMDADAINVVAENKTLLSILRPDTILTPHIKEFERLTKVCETDQERLSQAMELAKEYKIIVVLKGVYTAVINKDGKVYFNSTGNSSLAKGGSGDALTGIIAAHLAQGYSPLNAVILSVYVHGLSADVCIETQSKESVIASDIIERLGEAFLRI